MSGPDGVRELTCDEVREMAGAFVLGALDAADEAAVREHLVTCPEAHDEIAELGGVLPVLAESVPVVEPPDALKGRIMAAAAADQAGARRPATRSSRRRSLAPASARPGSAARRPGRGSCASPPSSRSSRWPAGTCVLRSQLSAAQQYEQAVAAILDAAARPGTLTAVLTPDGGTGSGLAAIGAGGITQIAMQDLAPTTGSTVYTVWLIQGSNAPLPLGSFTVGGSGTAAFLRASSTTGERRRTGADPRTGPAARPPRPCRSSRRAWRPRPAEAASERSAQ